MTVEVFRNRSPYRARSMRQSGQFVPHQLGFSAFYDANNGGSSTQITDSSGNAVDPLAFAATTASPSFLAYDGTPYVWLPGVNSNYVSAPDAAALDIVGDIFMASRAALTDWTPSGEQTFVSKWMSSNLSWNFRVTATGLLKLYLSADGTTAPSVQSSTATVVSDGVGLWVAAGYRTSDRRVQFFTGPDQPTEPAWTQLGTDLTQTAASIFAGTAILEVGGSIVGTNGPMAGKMFRSILRSGGAAGTGGTTVADFDAALCGQTGYTGALNTWSVNRSGSGKKAAVLGTVAGATRSVVVFGTDDYATAPAGAIPPMEAADAWSIVLVIRQWGTPTNFGRYLSTKDVSGTGPGIAIRTNGTTRQIACAFGDGTTTVDSFGPSAAASGVKQVVVVSCTGPSATIYVNGQAGTPVDVSTVLDRTTGKMEIGRDSGAASNYQDFELLVAGTAGRALSAGEASLLSTYYGGGS